MNTRFPNQLASTASPVAASSDPFRPPAAGSGVPGALVPPVETRRQVRDLGVDLYSDTVDLSQVLTPEQREAYARHSLTPGMPTWVFVVLSVITLGIFPTIYLQLKHRDLPFVQRNDPSAAKAIGFSFIPIFNLYWLFVVWRRLVNRINFQYRLRGHQAPVNPRHVIAAQIIALVLSTPLAVVGIGGSIWLVVLAAQLHSASNRLALGRV
jgi:Domain of unknown function (DUF4234)